MKDYLKKFSLEGKSCYVIGGCGLLGAEISRAMASAGGKLIILDVDDEKGRNLQEEIKNAGYRSNYEYFDLGDLDKMEANLDKLAAKYGAIDIWINASYPRSKDWPCQLEEMSLEYLRTNVDLHLNSFIWSSRKVALLMKEQQRGGVIINLASIYGVRANDLNIYEGTSMSGEVVYCAMKAGIINLTRYLASYFGCCGIRVVSLCPGGILDKQNKKFLENYNKKVPLRRMGNPEDIAAAALFLASDAASYISGATIMVDGGWTAI